MRKILAVVLAVVMLAVLTTAFPASADSPLPQLVITEICVRTNGISGNGEEGASSHFGFIEIYNSGTTDVNLYDYSVTRSAKAAGADAAGKVITHVDPIQQKGLTRDTIATANYANDFFNYFPTNPDTAILEPGKTAVVWFISGELVATCRYFYNRPVSMDDFKDYWRMENYGDAIDDILIVAVDAQSGNASAVLATVYGPTSTLANQPMPGAGGNALDSHGFTGRFGMPTGSSYLYGLIETSTIKTAAKGVPTSTVDDCVTYAHVNYTTADETMNLQYKSNIAFGQTGVASISEISHNFVYTNSKSSYTIGKSANNIKYADWDCVKYGTPGLLLPSQVANIKSHGSTPNANLEYVQKRVTTNDTSMLYTVYQQNFFGMADTVQTVYDKDNVENSKQTAQAFLDTIGWEMTTYLSNGGTARYYIENERLIVNNLDVDAEGNPVNRASVTPALQSADGIVLLYPSLNMEKIARSDYTIEYDLTYLEAQATDRFGSIIFNYNGKTSYDFIIIRVGGYGAMFRRVGGSTNITFDNATTDLYSGNKDDVAGLTSIISKITRGDVKMITTSAVNIADKTGEELMQYAPMLGRTLKVRIEVNQVTGPEFYINDILVSKAATILSDSTDETSAVAANPYWGAQTNYNEFAIGLFVSNRAKFAIDNIKVTGWVNEYTESDILRAYNAAPLKEPATGDATIYVAVAMAVSFVSLAAIVVVKRRRNED